MWLKHHLILILFLFIYVFSRETYERKPFFAVERPRVEYANPKFVEFATMTCRRYSRADPIYYFNLHIKTIVPFGNNFTLHFYFYQLLTNVYKPSFVELHLKFCTMLDKDPIFGAAVRRGLEAVLPNHRATCPIPPGDYNIQNCTLDMTLLKNFPFENGRIIMNMTFDPTREWVTMGHVDFQIKTMKIKKTT